MLISDDIQNESGELLENRYSAFDSVTHSTFLRVRDGNMLVYEGFDGVLGSGDGETPQTTDQDVINALDDNQQLLLDPTISNFISTATPEQVADFAEETKPQPGMAMETVNLAMDTAVLAINGRFQNFGMIFYPNNSSDALEEDLEGSFWVEGLYSKIDKETTSKSMGYDATVSGTSFGVDQSLNGRTLGLAYSYYDGRSDNSTGNIEAQIHQLSLYAQQELKDFYMKGILGGGISKNDSSRYIASVGEEAKGDYNTYNFYVDLELGKNYEVEDFIVTPYLGPAE